MPVAELQDPGPAPDPAGKAVGELALWRRWRESGDEEARARLLELHLPYARVVAATYYGRRFHDEIEFADYLQLASLGLIECVDRFDPAAGAAFRTFAARRMHGAILDGVERLTEKQQQIAARQRLLAQRRESLNVPHEAPHRANTSASRSEQVLRHVAEAGLAFALSWLLDGSGIVEAEERSLTTQFYRSVELRELRQRILDAVKALPDQERKVIHDHYLQEQPFEDIARGLDLSRGRVSQLHRQALQRLRVTLGDAVGCDLAL